MSFIDGIISKAKADPKHIILPEPEDERVLKAAAMLDEAGIAVVTLVGDPGATRAEMERLGIERDVNIVHPKEAHWFDDFAQEYYDLRKAKGMTPEKAREVMSEPIPHAVMMLNTGMAEGIVAGACHSTGDTLRPALQILRTAPGVKIVSSFFFMDFGETVYVFADCGLMENPDAPQLAEIAVSSAESAAAFDIPTKVAMLSYSTKGSASNPLVDKVVEATRVAKERAVERWGADSSVEIDGELQLDAAIVESVGQRKAAGSPVAGHARVLIFPDLNAGNIGYKLAERLGGASAYGPILQGLRKPVNDLSRGCSPEDIVGVAAVTCVQAQMLAE
jgi:phosphate acetyltransferase